MTNEETQRKIESAELDIWKIGEALTHREGFFKAIDSMVYGSKVSRKYWNKRRFNLPNNYQVLMNLTNTFGTSKQPVSDLQNRINCIEGPMKILHPYKWYDDGKPFNLNDELRNVLLIVAGLAEPDVKYPVRNNFVLRMFNLSCHSKDENIVGNRKMNRGQFEDLMMDALEGKLESEPPCYRETFRNNFRYMLAEHLRTPYTDRAVLGSDVQNKPYEARELTEQEWESYKEKYLNLARKNQENSGERK